MKWLKKFVSIVFGYTYTLFEHSILQQAVKERVLGIEGEQFLQGWEVEVEPLPVETLGAEVAEVWFLKKKKEKG